MTDEEIKLLSYNLIKNKTHNMGLSISDERLSWYVKGIVDLQSGIENHQKKLKYADTQASQLVMQSAT